MTIADFAMSALFSDYKQSAPTVNSGILLAVLGVLLRAWHTNRKLSLENRKLTLEDNKGLRAEFIEEMRGLRAEVTGLRADNASLRDEVHTLSTENEALRKEVRGLHAVIDGLRRDGLQNSLSLHRQMIDKLPDNFVPPSVSASLERIRGTDE